MSVRCKTCDKAIYPMDAQVNLDGTKFHKPCAKCADCGCQITISNFTKNESSEQTVLLCKIHYFKRFREGGSYLGGEKFKVKADRDIRGPSPIPTQSTTSSAVDSPASNTGGTVFKLKKIDSPYRVAESATVDTTATPASEASMEATTPAAAEDSPKIAETTEEVTESSTTVNDEAIVEEKVTETVAEVTSEVAAEEVAEAPVEEVADSNEKNEEIDSAVQEATEDWTLKVGEPLEE